ncbi:MAG TPA: hypothetical protein PLR06_00890 [Cyclobacteriaceae bacterium]|nr:hypothetical protein [Cyclobacteriaceae bacterium]
MAVEINLYVSLWNKYRPMILQLMSSAAQGPQQYKLFPHEFKSVGEKAKLSYAFTLEASKGKALNNVKTSAAARDLLQVLQQSKRAMQLMNDATYVLHLDKHFVFHVTRKDDVIDVPAVEPTA